VFVDLAGPPTPRGRRAAAPTRLDELEYALASLPRVVPRREGAAAGPGLARPLLFESRQWTLELLAATDDAAVRVTLCAAPSDCRAFEGEDVGVVVSSLRVALAPDAPVPAEVDEPPPSDAVRRWLAGRAAAEDGAWTRAAYEFGVAAERDPGGIAVADRAGARAAGGAAGELDAWRAVDRSWPGDPRFVLPIAIAEGAAGDGDAADARLATLPVAAERGEEALAARVEMARRAGRLDATALRDWATAWPDATEPVRLQLAAALEAGDLDAAARFADQLAARGATDEAARLRVALDHERDRSRAPEVGRRDPLATVAAGRDALEEGDAGAALRQAERVLRRRPWHPDALALQVDALSRLGRHEEASAARRRLRWAEPGR